VLRKQGEAENDITTLEATYRGYLLTGPAELCGSISTPGPRWCKRGWTTWPARWNWKEAKRPHRGRKTPREPTGCKRRRRPGIETGSTGRSRRRPDLTTGRALLDTARQTLQAMEDEEQELLKSHAQDQQNLSQSFQILLFAPKLENAISEMQEGEWGYLLTGDQARWISTSRR
jgi:hypothetical protein